MVKVLLVFEDYNQLTLAEVCLKKIGFDVLGLTNDNQLFDKMLGFPPQVIILSGRGSRVNSIGISQKIKESHRGSGKVIVALVKDQKPTTEELLKMKVDGFLESPLVPEKLIASVCRLSTLTAEFYLEKFKKLQQSDREFAQKMKSLEGDHQPEKRPTDLLNDPQRLKNYQKFVQNEKVDLRQTSHQREALKLAQENLKKGWNFDDLEEQDELRRQFAEALFKKPKAD
jgi:DNA-binding response OmpR family regulator